MILQRGEGRTKISLQKTDVKQLTISIKYPGGKLFCFNTQTFLIVCTCVEGVVVTYGTPQQHSGSLSPMRIWVLLWLPGYHWGVTLGDDDPCSVTCWRLFLARWMSVKAALWEMRPLWNWLHHRMVSNPFLKSGCCSIPTSFYSSASIFSPSIVTDDRVNYMTQPHLTTPNCNKLQTRLTNSRNFWRRNYLELIDLHLFVLYCPSTLI